MAPSQGAKWMFKLYLSLQMPTITKEERTKKGAPPYFKDIQRNCMSYFTNRGFPTIKKGKIDIERHRAVTPAFPHTSVIE